MLVDHVQELESAAVGRGIELEIHGPHLVGMLGPVTPHRTIGRPCPLSLPGSGALQAFLPPEPLHPLVIDHPALPHEEPVGHPAAPADVLSRDVSETLPELGLFQIDDVDGVSLGAAVLPHHLTDKALRSPVTLLQTRDGPVAPRGALCSATAFRAQKFPVAPQGAPHGATRSLSIAFSSSASAKSFLSLAFSFSS